MLKKRKIDFKYKNFKCYVLPAILQQYNAYQAGDFSFLIFGYARQLNPNGCSYYERVQILVGLTKIEQSKNTFKIYRRFFLEGKDTFECRFFPTMFVNFFLKRYFVEHRGLIILDESLKPICTSH